MQNVVACIYPLGCAIILIILVNFFAIISPRLYEPSIVELVRTDDFGSNESVAERMNRKRKILKRGCSMIATLFEMSQNGTSYEDLLTWHARIHDQDYQLSPSDEKCYPPLQYPTTILYHVPGEGSTSLFCLPPKCGTTSYQRALSQQVISLIASSNNKTMLRYVKEIKHDLKNAPYSQMAAHGDLEKIGKEKISSDFFRAPDVYTIMNIFKDASFQNPTSFLKFKNQYGTETVPIYPNHDYLKKRVINTRNPFNRLNAGWRDKYREFLYNTTTKIKFRKDLAILRPFFDRAELPGSEPPPGYIHSFHSFLRYVNQEQGESHLNIHWKSISSLCQPCRMVYNYIMDIDTAQEDSQYVFDELELNARLPAVHNHVERGMTLEDYYKDIPKSLIKKIYAKYYLDFVLYGFSTESVEAIVNIGTEEPSNYSYKSYKGFNSSEFNQHRNVIYRSGLLNSIKELAIRTVIFRLRFALLCK